MNKSSAYDATPGQGGGTVKKTLINLLVTLVFGLVYFYLELPALNLHDQEFYVFVFLLSAVWCFWSSIISFSAGPASARGTKTCFLRCSVPALFSLY